MHVKAFAEKGRSAIDVPNVTSAVLAALQTPSTCVPSAAVMLSMATTQCAHAYLSPRAWSERAARALCAHRVCACVWSLCALISHTQSPAPSPPSHTAALFRVRAR